MDVMSSVAPLGRTVIFGLDSQLSQSTDLFTILSIDEQERSARFLHERDRARYIVARARLRQMLATELAVAPTELCFDLGVQGKPALAAPWRDSGVKFNLSHSHGVALLGVAHGREIGVDVEILRQLRNEDAIARRFFSPREYADYVAVDAAGRNEAFFNCWTRKEAFIKALGLGLQFPLHSFDVTLKSEEPALIRRIGAQEGANCPWQLAAFRPAAGLMAAVVLEGTTAFEVMPTVTV